MIGFRDNQQREIIEMFIGVVADDSLSINSQPFD